MPNQQDVSLPRDGNANAVMAATNPTGVVTPVKVNSLGELMVSVTGVTGRFSPNGSPYNNIRFFPDEDTWTTIEYRNGTTVVETITKTGTNPVVHTYSP